MAASFQEDYMPEHSLKHLMNVILFLLSVLMQVKHSAALARTMGRAGRAAPASHTLVLLHLPADLKYPCWVLLLPALSHRGPCCG